MSNSLVAIPAGWPAAPRCRPTVFYNPWGCQGDCHTENGMYWKCRRQFLGKVGSHGFEKVLIGTRGAMSFAPLAFKLFYAARQNAVLRRDGA